MLGREDHVGRAEDRVGAGGENPNGRGTGNWELGTGAPSSFGSRFPVPGSRYSKLNLGTITPSDPIPLRGLRRLRPVDVVQVVQQPLRILADAEEPLLQEALLDHRAAALAGAVDDLLVR